MEKGGNVYILQSGKNGMYYIGNSEDIEKRLKEHNNGRVKATKNKGPWVVKFTQKFSTGKEARQMEYKIKKMKRKDYIERIIADGYIKMKI